MTSRSIRHGFTLIELVLVVGIILLLTMLFLIANNPDEPLPPARDNQRRADINMIINSVFSYASEKKALPDTIPTTPQEICTTDAASCNGGVSLQMLIGSYIIRLPEDPIKATATGTYYFISRDAKTSRVTVTAPGAEEAVEIKVTK